MFLIAELACRERFGDDPWLDEDTVEEVLASVTDDADATWERDGAAAGCADAAVCG